MIIAVGEVKISARTSKKAKKQRPDKYEMDVISEKKLLLFSSSGNEFPIAGFMTYPWQPSFFPVADRGAVEWNQNCIREMVNNLMDRRSETRLEKKFFVNIDKEGFDSMGLTANISRNGMFITINEILPINCKVAIMLGIDDDTYSLKGEVMWSRECNGTPMLSDDISAEAGIKITEAPENYLKYVEKMVSERN